MPDEINLTQYFQNATAVTELKNEGFTDAMILAFLQTAKETKSIISSRLPGRAGLELIEGGYDLKGFQIKAKSCDWGPMAGFICKLPFFNKKGYSNIDYNVNEIGHYLDRLEAFRESRGVLESFREKEKKTISKYKDSKENKCQEDLKIIWADKIDFVTKRKLEEQETGEWSGENTLDGTPFIHLKRFLDKTADEVETALNEFKGISGITKAGEDIIIGIAQNDNDQEYSIKTNFLLKREEIDFEVSGSEKGGDSRRTKIRNGKRNIWGIYHGEIEYRYKKKGADGKELAGLITETFNRDTKERCPFTGEHGYKKYSQKDKIFNKVNIVDTIFQYSSLEIKYNSETYYAVEGLMNPHPPYPNPIEKGRILAKMTTNSEQINDRINQSNHFRNAVSGDYDLFAFWPQIPGVNVHELIRVSEAKIGKQIRMGGKVLTTFLGDKSEVAIEFIPGFKELNPKKDDNRNVIVGEELKESAELGNINDLGKTIAQTINAFSYPYSRVNKAFHSDEGGRPGVMEIEFPIAIFFPLNIKTKALNNFYVNKKIGGFAGRSEKNTFGGLIKTVEELLLLIHECKDFENVWFNIHSKGQKRSIFSIFKKNRIGIIEERSNIQHFLIIMHSEWMMHLFYVSMTKENRDKFRERKETYANFLKFLEEGKTDEEKIKINESITKKLKEFEDIEKNLNKNRGEDNFDANQQNFEKQLKELVCAQAGPGIRNTNEMNDEYFNELRNVFLKLAFQSDRTAYSKRMEVEKLLVKYHKIYENYAQ